MPRPALFYRLLLVVMLASPAALPASDAAREIQGLLDGGQPERALAAAEAALINTGDDPEVRFLKGVTEAELGRNADAISTFEALTKDHPDLPEPHNNLAVLYAASGEFDKARDALLQAIAIHPSYAMAHENLGDIYARMAELSYRRAASLDASNAVARGKLARLDGLLTAARVPSPGSVDASAASSTSTSVAASAPSATVDEADLRAVVDAWAAAWTAQDVDGYLGSYGEAFRPARGMSLERWRAQRRQRLTRPSFIKVEIDRFQVVEADAARARVTFHQRYRSDGYSDAVSKELVLVQSAGQWKIQRERSLGAL